MVTRFLTKSNNTKTFPFTKVKLINYNFNNFQLKQIDTLDGINNNENTITWLDIQGLGNQEIINTTKERFNIHRLIVKDLNNSLHHPKIEIFDNHIFITFKLIRYENKKLIPNQISFVLSNDYVISFQENKSDIFDNVIERIEQIGKLRKEGPDYLVYELMNCIVESYFNTIENIAEEIEDLEEKVLNNPTKKEAEEIHRLKREIIFFRKQIWSTRELLVKLYRDNTVIKEKNQVYMRDIYDQIVQILDTLESLRDFLGGVLDIYLSRRDIVPIIIPHNTPTGPICNVASPACFTPTAC